MNPLIFNLLLGICGACVGAFINWAIYNLCYEERGSISPWNAPRDSASRRKLLDYVPIVGWLSLSRDDSVHGKLHWIRPLLIELTTALGAVWFYHWQMSGGLIDGGTLANPISPSELETWFAGHSLLIVLMLIATFIDFDEKTIPDWITIPGTLTALAIAAFYPRLSIARGDQQSRRARFDPSERYLSSQLNRSHADLASRWQRPANRNGNYRRVGLRLASHYTLPVSVYVESVSPQSQSLPVCHDRFHVATEA